MSFAQGSDNRLREIRIEGAQRIEHETIKSYMGIDVGDTISDGALDKALKSLFGTGLFADVRMQRDGSVIVVRIVENPIVNQIVFEGNKFLEKELLESEVKLRPRIVYTRSRVQTDSQRIIEIYRRSGRFAATVIPKIIKLPQNRVDLVFEINEGPPTEIRKIVFIGNRTFSDSDLREIIQTKESAWYRFLTSQDIYDPDRLTFDQELLRRHYLANGYADFRVVSAVAELTGDRKNFFITFTVEEGDRYRFGNIDIKTELKNVNVKTLIDGSRIKTGEWYNADRLENTIGVLSDSVGDLGYAFVDVRPKVRRDRARRIVDVSFVIREGRRAFVELVNITGNVRTLDKVVRREMSLVEGDAFNTSKLRLSRRNIQNLGFFDRVEVDTRSGSTPDKSVIEVKVKERSTGSISFGAGYSSTNGILGDTSIREQNLLGRGQDLKFGIQAGAKTKQADISFTEPYFLGKKLTAGFDIFRTIKDLQSESSYDKRSTGFALRTGYKVSKELSQRWKYTFRGDKITDVPSTASLAIKEQEGDSVTSSVGHKLLFDKRNNRLNPTKGYSVEIDNTIAGLGGDTRYFRNELRIASYYPVTEKWTIQLSSGVGYVLGLGKDVRIVDRFYLGGDSLRGFEVSGLGPRDSSTGDAVGGNWYYKGTLGVTFPVGLPKEYGVKGRIFSDAGSVGENDSSVSTIKDSSSLRLSLGTGLTWSSPIGPINIDFSKALLKESFDKTQTFRFSLGAQF
ncbi:MAG: outer membrane protein assembly factor BamA [Pseudomonadota bacterium]|nr:outer membrane protein assembly factor BamA [Pseudomonadota bacterium]